MMARSTTRSNQKPDTLMQDRTSARLTKPSCNARPDHTLGSTTAVISTLALSLLHLSHPTLVVRVGTAFCQMMGGDISVESEPDRGSTFTIRLPRIVQVPKEVGPANPAHTGDAALKPH
jgi:hypothetical protein